MSSENNFVNVSFHNFVNKHVPKKSKVFLYNQKPHLNKHSRLKSKADKSQSGKRVKEHKKEYFDTLNVASNSKPFWDNYKPY